MVAYQTGRHDLAVDLVSKAIAINPREASSHSNLGNLLLEQGRLDEAVASYRRALNLKPNFSEALNNLGNAVVIANRDLITSIDTSVAHLAAALGKPVWLLNCFYPCWRWLVGRRDRSTARGSGSLDSSAGETNGYTS